MTMLSVQLRELITPSVSDLLLVKPFSILVIALIRCPTSSFITRTRSGALVRGTEAPQNLMRQPRPLESRLVPGVARILPLVQFCQIRQAVYRELLGIALASGRKSFNI
jgi:hypothetical protein